jgi:hypothetical protein
MHVFARGCCSSRARRRFKPAARAPSLLKQPNALGSLLQQAWRLSAGIHPRAPGGRGHRLAEGRRGCGVSPAPRRAGLRQPAVEHPGYPGRRGQVLREPRGVVRDGRGRLPERGLHRRESGAARGASNRVASLSVGGSVTWAGPLAPRCTAMRSVPLTAGERRYSRRQFCGGRCG